MFNDELAHAAGKYLHELCREQAGRDARDGRQAGRTVDGVPGAVRGGAVQP